MAQLLSSYFKVFMIVLEEICGRKYLTKFKFENLEFIINTIKIIIFPN